MKNRKEDFLKILSELKKEPWFGRALRLRGGAPFIALHLLAWSYDFPEDDYFEISISKIGEQFGFHRTAISKMITRIEGAGLISVDRHDSNNRVDIKILQVSDEHLPARVVKIKSSKKSRSLKIRTDETENTEAALPIGIGIGHANK